MGDFLDRVIGLIDDPPKSPPPQPQFNISHLTVGEHKIQLGAFKVVENFSSFTVPLALYAMHQIVQDSKTPFVVHYKDFSSPPTQHLIKTDINVSSTVFLDYFSIIDGMMVTVQMVQGILIVTAYADSEVSGTAFFTKLQNKIKQHNFYKGKCLYFGGDEIDFVKPPTTSWDDVIAEDDLKAEVRLNAQEFFNQSYRKLNLFKRGIILHGPPGTGKTSIVKAVFSALEGKGVTRVYLTNETFGRMEMSTFFKALSYLLPAVVVFEDIDLIGGSRHTARSRVIGALLNHMDGVDKITEPLVTIGTTNDLEALDEALRNRPARFDRCLEVPIPKGDQISQFYSKLTGLPPSKQLVSLSEGFTGSHIEETVNTAYMMVIQAGLEKESVEPVVLQRFLIQAVKHIRRNFPQGTSGSDGPVGFNRKKKSDEGAEVEYNDDDFPLPTAAPDPADFPNRNNADE